MLEPVYMHQNHELRDQINLDVGKFLAGGGTIQQLSPGSTGVDYEYVQGRRKGGCPLRAKDPAKRRPAPLRINSK